MNDLRENPVGVFDSGVGGISVLKELVRLMPGERFIFRGDSAHAPYGTKSAEEVYRLAKDSVEWLLARDCKEIVVACNTATAVGVDALRKAYPDVPIVGIEPALKPAALENPGKSVLLMATPLTLKLERVALLRHRFEDVARFTFLPCRGLVEQIEAGHLDDDVLFTFLEELFAEVDKSDLAAVVLGCTHYPHVRGALGRFFGPGVRLYDGGEGTARRALAILREKDLLREGGDGSVTLFNTDPDPALNELARRLLYA